MTGKLEATQENARQIIIFFLANVAKNSCLLLAKNSALNSSQIDEEITTIETHEDENESRVGLSTRSEDGSTISSKEVEKSVWHRRNGINSRK